MKRFPDFHVGTLHVYSETIMRPKSFGSRLPNETLPASQISMLEPYMSIVKPSLSQNLSEAPSQMKRFPDYHVGTLHDYRGRPFLGQNVQKTASQNLGGILREAFTEPTIRKPIMDLLQGSHRSRKHFYPETKDWRKMVVGEIWGNNYRWRPKAIAVGKNVLYTNIVIRKFEFPWQIKAETAEGQAVWETSCRSSCMW